MENMKLGRTLFIGLATIGMVACSASESHGTEVEKNNFVAEAQKVDETVSYTKATLTYSINIKAKGYEGGNKNEKGKVEYTFSGGQFSANAGQKISEDAAGYIEDVVGANVKSALVELDTAPSGYTFKFFKDPLGFEMSFSSNEDVEGLKGSTEIRSYSEFNSNGYLVKETMETKTSYSGETAGVKVSYSTSSKVTISVSYK